ncbi:hypothetical protein Tco_1275275 [Tanacetum coccineum]
MRLLWWRRGCNGGVRLAADRDGGDGGVVETMPWWFRDDDVGEGVEGGEGGDVAVVGRLGTRRNNKVVAWRRVGWWIG